MGNYKLVFKESSYEVDELEDCSGFQTSILDGSSGFIQKYFEGMFLLRHGEDPETKFMFYSYRDPMTVQYVLNSNFSDWDIERSGFDASASTVFIIHGFKDIGSAWQRKIKNALMKIDKHNVFILEWGQSRSSYEEELMNIPNFGTHLATFVGNLKISKDIDLQGVYLIGHSIGAHIAGVAGKVIKQKLKRSIGRITALDPAGPNFYENDIPERLKSSDASFVDVIHTNGACNRMQGWGLPYAVGHFDFYPNGGYLQPGCKEMVNYLFDVNLTIAEVVAKALLGTIDSTDMEVIDKHIACSHTRSFDVFLASLTSDACQFLAVKCSSWKKYLSGQCDDHTTVVMGYHADSYKALINDSEHAKFYLETMDSPPFCVS
ncbi:pancreatic triacylglycerol lipase [Trichonephila clavipes]|nr:pancreatic triacylglycerol lipase [Trichonephila clavipes]